MAFRRALLLSERRRIYGITVFFVVLAVGIFVRIAIYRTHVSPWGAVILLLAAGYELWVSRVITRALDAGKDDVPRWLLRSNILMEIAVPALGVAYLSSPQIGFEYRPIANPWALGFFPLILLSVLRLNPLVSQLAGVIAAVAYLVSAYYVGWRPSVEHISQNSAAHSDVVIYAVIMVVTGFIAGIVSGEIRKYVEAALNEAEVQRQLKQVEHDLGIARSIQQSLLPRIRPTINGLEVSGWNLPADATGGDYFDWKKLRDGRVVVTLADVTGHGIGPALLASVCRAYARSSFDTHDDVVTAMQRVNQYFGEDLTTGRFATFVAAMCSEDGGTVELLSAGQGPLFVYHSVGDSFDELSAHAIPLGLMPELNADAPAVLKMEPGDMVVLATDGFFEWENAAGEQFGVGRLTQAVRAARHLPPEEIIAELYNAVKAFADGTKQADDLTAVVIKRVADARQNQ